MQTDGGGGGSISHISYRYAYGDPERLDRYGAKIHRAAEQASSFELTISQASSTAAYSLRGGSQYALEAQLAEREIQVNDVVSDLRSYGDAVGEFAKDVRSFRRALWDVRDYGKSAGLQLDRGAEHILFPAYDPPTGEGVTQELVDAYTSDHDTLVEAFWKCYRMRKDARTALEVARADLRDAVVRYAKDNDERTYDPNKDRYRRKYREEGREPEPGKNTGGGNGSGNGPGGPGNGPGGPGGPNGPGNGPGGPGGPEGPGGPNGPEGPEGPTEKEKRELVERIREQMSLDLLLGGVAGEDEHGVNEDKPAVRWDRETQSWQLTDRAIRAIEAENAQAAEAWQRSEDANRAYQAALERNAQANDDLEAALASGDEEAIQAARERAEEAYEAAQRSSEERNAAERTAHAEQAEADTVNRNAEQMLTQAELAGDGPSRPEHGQYAGHQPTR